MNKKRAFTLVEVLVTLGIIGIVAAMTMPNLMINHKKRVVETRLKNFYSIMNQAFTRWEKEQNILPEDATRMISNISGTSSAFETWFRSSIGPELNTVTQEKFDDNYYKVVLADGSGFGARVNPASGVLHFTYCVDAKYCDQKDGWGNPGVDGKNTFLFSFQNGKFITSYASFHEKTRAQLLSECKTGSEKNGSGDYVSNKKQACARLIQIDGWQIKDDYPW